MGDAPKLRTGGQQVVDALCRHGTDTIFCVPGESVLDVLNALHSVQAAIRLVPCRHEGGAAFMAEAHGKLTGRPGVCMVARGPGAANASIGVHTAFQDSTPMILLVGQVGRDLVDREAFQEIDYRRMFAPLAKWVAQIDDVTRVAEYMERAFSVALSGRQGPVVLALPEDMLTDSSFSAPRMEPVPVAPANPHPAPEALARLRSLLADAQRPLLWLGGSGWSDTGRAAIAAFASRHGVPVACSFRRQDLFDNGDPHYVGETGIGPNPALAEAVARSDLLIVVGARLGEIATSGYTLLRVPFPNQPLVHVLCSAEDLGRTYAPTLKIQATADAFATTAAALPADGLGRAARSAWRARLRTAYLSESEPAPSDVALDPAQIIRALRKRLDADAILTHGAGNYTAWAHRYYRFTRPRTLLAPTSGAMGYGVPAAIAAKIAHPDRQVVCLAGDGCFMMTSQELATARRLDLAIVYLVFDNGLYGTIRMHQEQQYPGRPIGTDLCNPDFVAYARAFGIAGERVTSHAGFGDVLERALAAPAGYLIDLVVDPETITPRKTLAALRRAADEAVR